MGQRFRLKKDFDISGFSSQTKAILEAMKVYGLLLADNGSDWFISGVPDNRWDNDQLHELRQVTGTAFEAVNVTDLMSNPDTGQVRPHLAQVICLLRVLAGQSLTMTGCDINNDDLLGLAEVIHALQSIAE